jgi:MoaA/NifB/PqqE/SkfB family radical SAM enzyme
MAGDGALQWDIGQPVKFGPEHKSLPAPEPSAGWAAYRAQIERALDFDPRRRANFEKYQNATRGAQVDYLPIKLDIENVSRCNFRCTMCQVSDWHKGQRAGDMPLAAFKQLIDEQYGLVEIKLQGMGEPLMQRDDYFEMLKYARSKEIWVRTTTNASLLHLRENYARLIDCDPNEVQISIDGATRDVFENIRSGSVFERVISNCQLINRYCQEKGVVRTKMWVVVQRDNRHQLRDFVRLAAKAGFPSLAFSLNLTDWGQAKWNTANTEVLAEDAFDDSLCHDLVEEGQGLGVKVAFWSVTEKYSQSSKKTLCPWPFERAYVSSDLRVVPCCTIANPEVSDLGSAAILSDTWHGEAFSEFRRGHVEGQLPEVCRGCYYGDENATAEITH